jgi:hypothetical protein
MKQAKLIFTFLIVMLICCSYSIGQSPFYVAHVGSSGIVSLGNMKVNPVYVSQLNFICDVMASCGLYPTGPGDIRTGASVYPASYGDIKTGASAYPIGQISNGEMIDFGGIRSGETLSRL